MNPTPTVPLGGQESFWCETQNESGHKYRRLLTYMNEYEMGLADDCDSAPLDNVRYDEEKDTWYWTGWISNSLRLTCPDKRAGPALSLIHI